MRPGEVLVPALLAAAAVLLLLLPEEGPARLRGVLTGSARPGTPTPARRAGRRDRAVVDLPLAAGSSVCGLLLLAVGLPAALAAALGVGAGRGLLRARRRSREQAAERAGALEACAALASELRAGRSAGEALGAAADLARGPFGERLAAAAAAARLGGDPAAALDGGPGSRPTAVAGAASGLSACWRVCSGTGAGLAAAVERLEEGLRAAEGARRAVDAELAGPRSTAVLLALLPLAGVGLAAALGARPEEVLLGTPLGGVCLVAGTALDLLGLVWTRRLARAAGARW